MITENAFFVTYKGNKVLAGTLCNRVFHKAVSRKDKLQLFDAFGLDVSYMEQAIALGLDCIELHIRESGEVYTIQLETFLKYAVTRTIGKFPSRYYCSMKYWQQKP